MIVVKILYADDQCGAGKTRWALQRMASKAGRYVLVIDRREVAKDRRRDLLDLTETTGATLHVEEVFSDDDRRQTVGERIADAGRDLFGNRHVVLIITHAGMMKVKDWGGFTDWDAILIDEVPSIIDHEVHHTCPFEQASLAAFYDLAPAGEGQSAISFRGGYSAQDLSRSSSAWVKFHQRVMAGDALCDLASWDDLAENREWSSWRVWDASKLRVFGEVRILGDSFTDTDTFHLLDRQGGFEFERFNVAAPRAWAKRPVTIRYVSEDKRAGTRRFADEANAPEMKKVGAWLAQAGDEHIWTCNGDRDIERRLKGGGVRGVKLAPKQAGSNAYRGFHKASAIYAAKPSPAERRFYAAREIEPEVIEASRETYDLKQFFMRTSLREPSSTAAVELRVLDRWQADAFATYLEGAYGLMAERVLDDIGLAFAERPRGRPKTSRTKTAAERQRQKNEGKMAARQRERDKLAELGIVRKPGRPAKDARP